MRIKLTSVVMICLLALSGSAVFASPTDEDAKKKEEAKQAQQKKAAAKPEAKDAAKKDAAAKGTQKKDGEKAAVNTLEDVFAAYSLRSWSAKKAPAAAVEAVVWKERPAATKKAKAVPAKK